ncbi:MAG: toprim domain-containing protein [Bauldia sp.]
MAIPTSLRFHPDLKHPDGSRWPAMVALVTDGSGGTPVAIHRTFLTKAGAKAPVTPVKMMLGPCAGGVVRLEPEAGERLLVGEGIETCLAVIQATGLPVWSALSTSGLRSLRLPPTVREVTVLADGDAPGEGAAEACAIRLSRAGRTAAIARPRWGADFADMLLDGAVVGSFR